MDTGQFTISQVGCATYYGKNIKYFKSTIGISFDFTKVITNMKHYSEREKWFHKLKWLLGRIKSCKCGNARHIGKLDEDGNESSLVKQLKVLFK